MAYQGRYLNFTWKCFFFYYLIRSFVVGTSMLLNFFIQIIIQERLKSTHQQCSLSGTYKHNKTLRFILSFYLGKKKEQFWMDKKFVSILLVFREKPMVW